jgi:excisionase family DNA binding protein
MLTVRDVASELSVSATCVYQLIASGKLPCHRIGIGRGAIRVSEVDLAAFLDGCREIPTPLLMGRTTRTSSKPFKHL